MATFKSEAGQHYTKSLFVELTQEPSVAIYSLKDYDFEKDGKIYPSIKRLFVETEDSSEYFFATTYFDSWKHYKKLLQNIWFRSMIEEAREELSVRLAAKNLHQIRKKADSGDLKANQYLLDKSLKDPVGRPSKARIKEEAQRIYDDNSDISDDLRRIMG
jgi:hypothetical protein